MIRREDGQPVKQLTETMRAWLSRQEGQKRGSLENYCKYVDERRHRLNLTRDGEDSDCMARKLLFPKTDRSKALK